MKYIMLLLAVMALTFSACSQAEITSYEECVAAGNPVMESYPEKCSANGETFTRELSSEEQAMLENDIPLPPTDIPNLPGDKACTREYRPVCGQVQVQCVTTPCDPIKTTFSNACEAENAGATNIVEGACVEKEVNLEGACLSFDGRWLEESQECEGMSEEMCSELGGTFNGCASACRNNPDAEMCTMQCVIVCDFDQ